MHEPSSPESADLKALWRDQPREVGVGSPEHASFKARHVHATTRSEILMAGIAAVFFALILVWRLGWSEIAAVSVMLITAWVVITLVRLRRCVSLSQKAPLAASGVEFYRNELEQRRKHLRSEWLWHGPLVLACVAMAAVLVGSGPLAYKRLTQVSPLIIALVVWAGFSVRQRLREVDAIERELSDMREGARRDGE